MTNPPTPALSCMCVGGSAGGAAAAAAATEPAPPRTHVVTSRIGQLVAVFRLIWKPLRQHGVVHICVVVREPLFHKGRNEV